MQKKIAAAATGSILSPPGKQKGRTFSVEQKKSLMFRTFIQGSGH
jgi:hypothetical protein